MTDKKLMASLSKLGFPVFEPEEQLDVNETLAAVVKSNDTRLWEGFPVLLANAAEGYQFAPAQVEKQLRKKRDKDIFRRLVLISGALFSFYHLSFAWWNKLEKGLSDESMNLLKRWKSDLVNNRTIKFDDAELDPDRLKNMFGLYFEKKVEKDKRLKEKYQEYSLEYALSHIFSKKQKELFKKKLEGIPFTKTEQEYYSRTVKKKVTALANSELHSLSKKLLGL